VADLPALETFVAVARLGSVVRAAERLGRTQPSLSARLASLEAQWKTKLFRRHARGMVLTPEGTRLLALAEAALQSLGAVDRAAGLPVAGEQELRVGAGDALGREVLPRAIAALLRENPALSIRLLEGAAPRLIDALRAGDIDVALLTGAASGDASERGADVEPLLTSAVEVLVPIRERGDSAVTPAWLAGRRIVSLQRGSGFRRHVEEAFAAAGVPFRPAVEVGNLSLVRRFVAAGLGVAAVPSIAFPRAAGPGGVRRRPLRGVPPVVYRAASRAGVPLSQPAGRLLELLRIPPPPRSR
jgi:DNA-binding transcriptional LysR family regulator